MTIKVCVSIPPKTINEALELIEKAEAQYPDFIEVRLDSLNKHEQLADLAHSTKTPLIATNKSTKNHGSYSGNENQRLEILMDAAKMGFEYVDFDLATPNLKEMVASLDIAGTKKIISFHDYNCTPKMSLLNMVLKAEVFAGADVCKIVTTASCIEDNLRILDFVSRASKKAKLVCFAMGELGKISRLLSAVFGAFFTFVSLDRKRKTAKGQLTIQEIRRAYEALGIK